MRPWARAALVVGAGWCCSGQAPADQVIAGAQAARAAYIASFFRNGAAGLDQAPVEAQIASLKPVAEREAGTLTGTITPETLDALKVPSD